MIPKPLGVRAQQYEQYTENNLVDVLHLHSPFRTSRKVHFC